MHLTEVVSRFKYFKTVHPAQMFAVLSIINADLIAIPKPVCLFQNAISSFVLGHQPTTVQN